MPLISPLIPVPLQSKSTGENKNKDKNTNKEIESVCPFLSENAGQLGKLWTGFGEIFRADSF